MNDDSLQGVELEARILGVFRRKSNYYKYRRILQENFFQTVATRSIFGFIEETFSSGKTEVMKLTIPNLRLMAIRNIRNREQRIEIIKLLKVIRKFGTRDNEVMDTSIKDFVKRQLVKTAVLRSLEELEKPNPDFVEIHDTVGRALAVTTEGIKDYYGYFEDSMDRLEERNEHRIKTGIPTLDEAFGGGTTGGDLVVILAPPERGKTLLLVNLAAAALYQGLNVGYLTLELSERKIARRFDLRISGKPLSILKNNAFKLKKPLRDLRKNGCNLVIKDYSSSSPKIHDIRSFIINYQNRMKRNFDIMFVDYADLITSSKDHKQERFETREVYTNLRRVANEFKFPIITASQANRKSVGKKVVTMEDFAEDFSKAAIADAVVAICQSPEELEEELARLYIAKNRMTGKHSLFRVNYRPKIMYAGERRSLEIKPI